MAAISLGEAAKRLGVSVDTLRRWDRAGSLRTLRDDSQPPPRAAEEVERLGASPRAPPHGRRALGAQPLPGRRALREVDGVMALVEIEAGPFLVTAAITRDAVEELGLARARRRPRP